MKLNESGACGGNRSAHSLPIPEGSQAPGPPTPRKSSLAGTNSGPAPRNKEEQVSSGPRTQTWEDSSDLLGNGL